jgi:RNA polymerase sigma-70 factor (sigma-E family)
MPSTQPFGALGALKCLMARVRPSFEEFVARHGDGLLRTAFLIAMDPQEAEDLVQECLLYLSRRWGRVAAMEHPLAYARRVLINLAIRGSEGRRRRRVELEAPLPDTGTYSAELELVATRDELRGALEQLTPRQRAILVLRYFNDMTEEQVAEILGCATGTVKSTASRSLVQLRELIDPAAVKEGAIGDERHA